MMKKIAISLSSLLVAGMIFLSGCTDIPTTTPVAETRAEPTVTEAAPTPVLTEEPILACNIVFDSDRDGNLEIYTMVTDGSNQINLTNDPGDDFDPVWSPGGTRIAFVSNRVTDAGGGQYIYTMRADGSDVVQISQQNESLDPDWSPLGDRIAYSNKGDIFLIRLDDGTEVNLTDSPEQDLQPKFSPDGQKIAWIKGGENNRQLFVMELDGSHVVQLTNAGTVFGAEWAVDGRILVNWDNPTGLCHNCVITSDGKEVADAGGKGTIQQYLPVWTSDGYRVEMGSGDIQNAGNEDIFLVGENFPDLFLFLTNSPGNDRNPDTAFKCGPTHGAYPQYGSGKAEPGVGVGAVQPDRPIIIGYTGSLNKQMQSDIDKACSELKVQCIKDEDIATLADQGVDAIISSSNRWDVMGSYPQIHNSVERGIPVFVLNAESNEKGVFNLSAEHEIYTITLNWMFQQMSGKGKFIYYNFGNSNYIQEIVNAVLNDYPGITAIKKDADYSGNSFTQQEIVSMIAENPDLRAIWSTDQLNDIFWAINSQSNSHPVLTECMARKDELIAWKNEVDAGSPFQCFAQIRPGGTAYEGVYVAYYYLSGFKFKPDAFTSKDGNTLKYDVPIITNKNLPDWIGEKLDPLRIGEHGILQLPPMTPKEIMAAWFIE